MSDPVTGRGGLSRARLGRLHDAMAGYVERGEVPGIVTAVSRHGETYVDEIGAQAVDGAPMRRDTIFRIASLTKPVVAVAALLLIEECRLRLDEPVERLLPELADRRVLRSVDAPLDDIVPAQRPITVRDLLTFRAGFGIVMAPPPATYPIQQALRDLQVEIMGPPQPQVLPAPDEWLRRLGTLPLVHQPGERWLYNTSADALGVLIARAAGQPLEAFLRERIFEPLGMKDTSFSVPSDKLHRLATGYTVDLETGTLAVFDDPAVSQWGRPPAFPSGGGGLVSTVDDYLAFGLMLLSQGRHSGGRLLSRPAVELMTTDHLTPEQKAVSGLVPGAFDSHGWGFGVTIQTRRDDFGQPGRFGWDGGLGTSWYVDPKEDLVGILMTQRTWTSPSPPDVCLDFWTSVYQAIDD